jgi:argininosuccinate synthase
MRNLDIADSRDKLELYVAQGQLGSEAHPLVGRLEPGGAERIETVGRPQDAGTGELLDDAAMEYGTD